MRTSSVIQSLPREATAELELRTQIGDRSSHIYVLESSFVTINGIAGLHTSHPQLRYFAVPALESGNRTPSIIAFFFP